MSAKNKDNKNRWRNITVGFRVSPEESEQINKAVRLSGLSKQDYITRRSYARMWLCREIRGYISLSVTNLLLSLQNYSGLRQETELMMNC